jgi:AraC-like DNA-binding protein
MKSTNREILIIGDDLVITNILSPKEQNNVDLAEVLKEVEVLLRYNGLTGFDNELKQQFEHVVSELLPNPGLKVSDVAMQLNLSVSTLGRWCYRTYGVSPMKYIYNFRLSKAAGLLAQNYGRVKEVAYETGFSSLSYFSKCYKDKFGVPPTKTNEKRIQLFE